MMLLAHPGKQFNTLHAMALPEQVKARFHCPSSALAHLVEAEFLDSGMLAAATACQRVCCKLLRGLLSASLQTAADCGSVSMSHLGTCQTRVHNQHKGRRKKGLVLAQTLNFNSCADQASSVAQAAPNMPVAGSP